jgi:hypothetical protein
MALICQVLFLSISTFETPPSHDYPPEPCSETWQGPQGSSGLLEAVRGLSRHLSGAVPRSSSALTPSALTRRAKTSERRYSRSFRSTRLIDCWATPDFSANSTWDTPKRRLRL